MTDIIFIHGLAVDTVIGVNPHERNIRQTLVLDLDIETDLARAGTSDDLNDTLDYSAIADRVRAIAGESDFLLIEAFANAVCSTLLRDERVTGVTARITKPGVVRSARDVGISITRRR